MQAFRQGSMRIIGVEVAHTHRQHRCALLPQAQAVGRVNISSKLLCVLIPKLQRMVLQAI